MCWPFDAAAEQMDLGFDCQVRKHAAQLLNGVLFQTDQTAIVTSCVRLAALLSRRKCEHHRMMGVMLGV